MKTQICIPLANLAANGDGDETATPVKHDRVSFQVEGTVNHLAGPNAYIDIDTIDGEPLDQGDPAEPTDDEVRSLAQAQDAEDQQNS